MSEQAPSEKAPQAPAKQMPLVDYLVLGDEPYLRARQCDSCQAQFLDRRNACASCGERSFTDQRLANTGKVRTFTIVHRAARGVPAPYVSAVVDVDGGGRVKSNIVNVAAEPENITLGMPVRLTTYVAATDDDGNEAVAFGYEPVGT